jgi:hypothetical protein
MAKGNKGNKNNAVAQNNTPESIMAAYAAVCKATSTAPNAVLPNLTAAVKTLAAQANGTQPTAPQAANVQASFAALQSAITVLQAMGKPIGASATYNLVAGRTCYQQKLHAVATGLGSSKTIATLLAAMGMVRTDAPRQTTSKAGNAFAANHGKFTAPAPVANPA